MYDSNDLYRQCTSTLLAEVHTGFQRLGNYLLPVVRRQLNQHWYDHTVVEDCVQDALRDIWRAMQQGNGPQSPDTFWAWAIKIAQRRGLDKVRYLRRRQTETLPSEEEGEGMPSASIESTLPDEQPETRFLLDEKLITLVLTIHNHPKLSDKSKAILIEGFLFEKTDVELARALLTPQSNIRLIRHRNLEKLRDDSNFLAALQQNTR